MLTAALFGTSWRMDGIAIALEPLNIMVSLLSGASARILIPMYIEMRKKSRRESGEFAWNVLMFMGFLYALLGLVLLTLPRQIVALFAPGFPEEVVLYTARKMRYLAFFPMIMAFQNVLISILRAERRFREIAVSGAVFNLFAIPVIYYFAPMLSEASYVFGWMIGTLAVVSFMLFFSRDILKVSFKPFDKSVLKLFRKTLPLSVGGSLGLINRVVDKAFVSLLPSGRVASLKYSQVLIGFMSSITGYFTQASYTELSEKVVNGDLEGTERRMRRTIESSLNITVPSTLWIITAAEYVVRFVYERGAFTTSSTNLVSAALIGYSFLVIVSPISMVTSDYLVLKERFRFLLVLGTMNVGMNALLDWVFLVPFQHAGVALSTSLVSFFATCVKGYEISKYGVKFMPWRRLLFLISINVPAAMAMYFMEGLYKLVLGNAIFALAFYLSAGSEIRVALSKIRSFVKRRLKR